MGEPVRSEEVGLFLKKGGQVLKETGGTESEVRLALYPAKVFLLNHLLKAVPLAPPPRPDTRAPDWARAVVERQRARGADGTDVDRG